MPLMDRRVEVPREGLPDLPRALDLAATDPVLPMTGLEPVAQEALVAAEWEGASDSLPFRFGCLGTQQKRIVNHKGVLIG